MVFAYLKGWFMHWRLVAWLCVVYSVVPVILILFVPESPPWLVSRGQIKRAKKSLDWLNKFQPTPDHKVIYICINDKILIDSIFSGGNVLRIAIGGPAKGAHVEVRTSATTAKSETATFAVLPADRLQTFIYFVWIVCFPTVCRNLYHFVLCGIVF